MNLRAGAPLLRRAAIVFLAAVVAFGAIGALWLRDMRGSQVVVLGSGDQLSALVTTGDARLLVATGNDPAAFAEALERARHPIARRLDVLLVAGNGRALLAPASLRSDAHVRFTATIGPLSPSPETTAIMQGDVQVLPTPRLIRLADDLTVLVETASLAPTSGTDAIPAWRVVVRRGATVVVLLSDGRAAGFFPPLDPVSALVVAGAHPLDAWSTMPTAAIVAPSTATSGRDLRAAASSDPDAPRWAIRVFPGEIARLRFVPGGLELPADAAQPLPATPAAIEVGAEG